MRSGPSAPETIDLDREFGGRLLNAGRIEPGAKCSRECASPTLSELLSQDRGHLRETLDSDTLAAAWAEGRTMTLEQTVEFALGAAQP